MKKIRILVVLFASFATSVYGQVPDLTKNFDPNKVKRRIEQAVLEAQAEKQREAQQQQQKQQAIKRSQQQAANVQSYSSEDFKEGPTMNVGATSPSAYKQPNLPQPTYQPAPNQFSVSAKNKMHFDSKKGNYTEPISSNKSFQQGVNTQGVATYGQPTMLPSNNNSAQSMPSGTGNTPTLTQTKNDGFNRSAKAIQAAIQQKQKKASGKKTKTSVDNTITIRDPEKHSRKNKDGKSKPLTNDKERPTNKKGNSNPTKDDKKKAPTHPQTPNPQDGIVYEKEIKDQITQDINPPKDIYPCKGLTGSALSACNKKWLWNGTDQKNPQPGMDEVMEQATGVKINKR